jgi:low density lipoprotein receptor-related protein 5/6
MYWVDFGLDRISRATYTGGGITTVFQAPSTANLRASTLDVPNNRLYYTNFTDDTINRVNFDGTGNSIILDLPSNAIPLGLSLDGAANHIYFTDNGTNAIRRVNTDGTGLVDLITTGLDSPANVQLDLINGKMYWVDFGNVTQSNVGRIERANLDGSDRQTLLSNLPLPEDIALDVLGGKFYWTDGIDDVIRRANLDGSGAETVVSGNSIDFPFSLALDVPIPEPTCASIIVLAGAVLFRRRSR